MVGDGIACLAVRRRVRFHEPEVFDLDRLRGGRSLPTIVNARGAKRFPDHRSLLVQAALRILDVEAPGRPCSGELLDEIAVKRAAPVLAVGDRVEPRDS